MTRASFLAGLGLLLLAGQGPSGAAPPAAEDFHASYGEFAVAADQTLASQAGAEILAAGGNAADAAAATMLALGVVNPASSGMGGGGFLLYYEASSGELTFLDFREKAPAAATPDMFEDAASPMEGPANHASQVGGLASGVPGEPAGIAEMVERFGSLPLSRIVEPAVRYAEGGVPVSDPVARMSGYFAAQMKRDPVMRGWFAEGAAALAPGQTLTQPELGRTLRAFGRAGFDGIYRGRVAREIVRANNGAGGLFTMADLAAYDVKERAPLEGEHFGYRWVTAPPPSAGGFTLLQSLAILERIPEAHRPVTPGERPGAAYLHALAESWKGPFLDRQRYFGDPDHVTLYLDRMMEPERLAARAAAFHPTLAMPAEDYDLPLFPDEDAVEQPDNAGTSHLCVVDAAGNVAAVTTTVNLPFGARYTGAGIVLNDEMDDFARAIGEMNAFGLPGGAPNLPGPGKRPISSMTPTIIFGGDGQPVMCAGAAGGSRIVTATQQVAMHHLLFGMPLGEALSAPRVHHQGAPNQLRTENVMPMDAERLGSLVARGHVHEPIRNVANVQTISIRREDGRVVLTAASDPRKGGRPSGR
ncbi:MAG: gamma-glutamyltransferase [Myxococcota bacterium]